MNQPPRAGRGAHAAVSTAIVTAFATVVIVPLLPSCRGVPVDGFELSVPAAVASQVTWYEVGVFPGPGCSALTPELTGGIPAEGYVQRLAFLARQGSPPGITNLPRAKYAVGVAARAADCSGVATGCTHADLTQASAVTVVMNAVATPRGACTNGATCEDAECTPGNGNVGAGCSLAFVGGGPLADPLGLEGTVMSAPALAATPTGFLIAHRECDPTTGDARVTVIPVDEEGGIGTPQQSPQTSCPVTQLSDATALVFSGSDGVAAAARGGCPQGSGVTDSGIDLFPVDSTGALGTSAFADLGQARVFLSTAHAMAESSAGTFLAYTQSGAASVTTLNGTTLGTPTAFGGNGQFSDAWVAASDQVVALLADGTPGGAAQGGDGGAGSSGEAGAGDDSGGGTGADDASATPSVSTLSLGLVAAPSPGQAVSPVATPALFPGNWGSVSALAGRAFVASDGQTSDQPVAYRAFDVGTSAPSVVGAYNPQGTGPVLYADIAFHQDHLFVAVERPGEITLDVFNNATTTPTLLREVPLSGDPRIPTTEDVRDGRVAVLATDTRVIVAWTTQEALGSDDATGGFAVFACTTP